MAGIRLSQRAPGAGRPHKGERYTVTARLPLDHAKRLYALADARGMSVSDFVASAVIDAMAAMPDPAVDPAQQELPIQRAS